MIEFLGALDRRSVLTWATVSTALALTAPVAGCARSTAPASTPAPAPVQPNQDQTAGAVRALEAELPGRIGVYAIDTGSGASVGYRANERFLLCSTGKLLVVAAVLRLSTTHPDVLSRRIRYVPSDVVQPSPITSKHVADGMTVAELCDAAITVSDNSANNLLVGLLGGTGAVTDFARSLGDTVTRVDRLEPYLNTAFPGDDRDTTTPAHMASDLRALVLGDALAPSARDRLIALLESCSTGDQSIRAGVPRDWRVGDKTGTGAAGESNDVAVAWPTTGKPLAIAIYTSPTDPNVPVAHGHSIVARTARIVTSALTGVPPR